MDLMDLVKERVRIMRQGQWQENQVEIKISKKYVPEITEEMKKVAQDRFNERWKKNPKIYDGDVYHLDLGSSEIQPKHILLAVGPMKYSFYDIARQEYAEKYGWGELPTGIGTVVVIITSDSRIVLHNRSAQVDHKAKIGAIGGIYDGGHPFQYIKREMQEEVDISAEEIENITLMGIYNRLDERVNHGLTFFARTLLSSEEILRKEKKLTEKEGEIFFLEEDGKILRAYLKENHINIISDSFAGLVLVGRYLWDKKWSEI